MDHLPEPLDLLRILRVPVLIRAILLEDVEVQNRRAADHELQLLMPEELPEKGIPYGRAPIVYSAHRVCSPHRVKFDRTF